MCELRIHARKLAKLSGDDWRKVEMVLDGKETSTRNFKSKDLIECLELHQELRDAQTYVSH